MEYGMDGKQVEAMVKENGQPTTVEVSNSATCCRGLAKLRDRVFPTGYISEFRGTAHLAWALVLTEIAEQYFQPIATMFGGHLGTLELDAISLANAFITVLGTSVVVGLSTSCDTVFSQAYGHGNYKLIGVLLQRSLIIHILALLPCYAIHLNLGPILLAFGQDPEVSRFAAKYLIIFMPGMFFMFLWVVLRKYTQCQNIVVPHIIIAFIVHAVHAVLQYVFLYQLNLGIEGSAAAQSCAFFLLFLLTLIYTLRSDVHKACWGGWDRRCLYGWGPLAHLAVFGMLMICMEWWAFEISTILCGILGTTELAAQTVVLNTDSLLWGIPSGISVAVSIRAGQFLGSGAPEAAKNASRVGMTITGSTAAVLALVFALLRYQLPKLFTDDREVLEMVASIIPFLSAYVFCDAVTLVGRGVLRAAGKQMLASVPILVAYYIIGLPIGVSLMFLTPLGIFGLWWSLGISLALVALSYFVWVIFKMDWEKLSREAMERSSSDKGELKTEDYDKTPEFTRKNRTEVSEKTPLLANHVIMNGTVKREDPEEPMGELVAPLTDNTGISCSLIFRRVATMLIFVVVLLCGILARIFTPDVFSEQIFNETTTIGSVPVTL